MVPHQAPRWTIRSRRNRAARFGRGAQLEDSVGGGNVGILVAAKSGGTSSVEED